MRPENRRCSLRLPPSPEAMADKAADKQAGEMAGKGRKRLR